MRPSRSSLLSPLLSVPLLLFAPLPVAAQSPCDGRIKDKVSHPMTARAVPKPAAGQSYVDPVFGTKITRISAADPAEGTSAVISTLYNSMRGWNADGSQIIAWHRGGAKTYEFYQGDAPYARLGRLVFQGTWADQTAPADIEHVVWDSSDPNVLYYPAYDSKSSRKHPVLMKVTLHWPSAPTSALVRDFNAECQAQGITSQILSLGHGQDMSYDGRRLIGLRCGNSGSLDAKYSFLYSITENRIVGGYRSIDNADSPPWPCPSGACSWRQRNGWVYDAQSAHSSTTKMANPLEHSTVGRTIAGGYDFVAQSAFDENPAGNLLIWKLNQTIPTPITIVGQATGWPYPVVGSHPSLGAFNGSGWVAVGMIGSGLGTAGVLDNEIILANVDSRQVCRIAHARTRSSKGGQWGYWSETHPQISADGYRVLFNSDWENSNTVDMYVIDLRPKGGVPAPTPAPPATPAPPPTGAPPPTRPPSGPTPNGQGTTAPSPAMNADPTGLSTTGEAGFGGGGAAGYSFAARTTDTPAGTTPAASSTSVSTPRAPSSANAAVGKSAVPGSDSILRAVADLKAGKYERAARGLEGAVETTPDNAAAHYYLGYAYYLMSQQRPTERQWAAKAAEEFAKSYALQPNFLPAEPTATKP